MGLLSLLRELQLWTHITQVYVRTYATNLWTNSSLTMSYGHLYIIAGVIMSGIARECAREVSNGTGELYTLMNDYVAPPI